MANITCIPSFKYSLLLLLECLMVLSVGCQKKDDSKCKDFTLSSHRDSRTVPRNSNTPSQSHGCIEGTNECNFCSSRIITSDFTMKMYKLCYSVPEGKCTTALWNSQKLKGRGRCLSSSHAEMIYYSQTCSCCDPGKDKFYLQPRSSANHALLQEHCGSRKELRANSGSIVSEFKTQPLIDYSLDLCPIIILPEKKQKDTKFCVEFSPDSFMNPHFFITVMFVKETKDTWKFYNTTIRNKKKFCKKVEDVRIIVEATRTLQDHQVFIYFSFKYDDEYQNEENKDEDEDDDDQNIVNPIYVTLVVVSVSVTVLIVCIAVMFKKLRKQARAREQATDSSRPQSEMSPQDTGTSSQDTGMSGNSMTLMQPSAQVSEEDNGNSDMPPSYESLFPSK